MSQITKLVNRAVPVQSRSQVFTQADAVAGDIILVQDSLGKPAKTVQIQAGAAMTIRFNVLHKVFPPRDTGMGGFPFGDLSVNTAMGVDVEDTSQAVVTLAINETFSLDNDISIQDIKIVTAAGTFEIFVA